MKLDLPHHIKSFVQNNPAYFPSEEHGRAWAQLEVLNEPSILTMPDSAANAYLEARARGTKNHVLLRDPAQAQAPANPPDGQTTDSPAPGSLDAIAAAYRARMGGGFGLQPIDSRVVDLPGFVQPAPAQPPAPVDYSRVSPESDVVRAWQARADYGAGKGFQHGSIGLALPHRYKPSK